MLNIYGVPISVHIRKAIVAAIAKKLPHEVRSGGADLAPRFLGLLASLVYINV